MHEVEANVLEVQRARRESMTTVEFGQGESECCKHCQVVCEPDRTRVARPAGTSRRERLDVLAAHVTKSSQPRLHPRAQPSWHPGKFHRAALGNRDGPASPICPKSRN